jgi:hypothetical protein
MAGELHLRHCEPTCLREAEAASLRRRQEAKQSRTFLDVLDCFVGFASSQ